MLSMDPIGSASYYLELARESYFLEGGEPPGKWFGKGAEKFGLNEDKQVTADDLNAILRGEEPGRPWNQLVQQHKNRQQGWDLCFSAPKSVSVFWSQADPRTRAEIQEALRESVKASLTYLEKVALETRKGKGGANHELARGAFYALFEHATSRAEDPQLHIHALISNLCVGLDDKTRTIVSRELYRHKMAAGVLFRAELAAQLLQRLALQSERVHSWFELTSVPVEVREHFSKRAEQIRVMAREYGWSSPKVKASLAVASRAFKGHINREELFQIWGEEGFRIRFSRGEVDNILGQAEKNRPAELTPEQKQTLKKTIAKEVNERLSEQVSYFRERDLVAVVAECCQGTGLDARESLELSKSIEKDLVLLPDEHSIRPYFTTKEMHKLEAETLAQAQTLSDRQEFMPILGDIVAEAIDEVNAELQAQFGEEAGLSQEQIKGVYHLVENPSKLGLLQGLAGTGKTSLLKAARIAWEHAGYEVIGCAVSAKAARKLEASTGIKSQSLAKTLSQLDNRLTTRLGDGVRGVAQTHKKRAHYPNAKHKIELPERLQIRQNTVVVLDEASMVATKEWNELQGHIVKGNGTFVATGDRHQIQSIGAGGPFNSLLLRHDRVELTDIRRQRYRWMREAIQAIAEGDIEYAITEYAEHNCIDVREDKDQAIAGLVNEWLIERTSDLSETLVLASTNQEVRELNRKIQTMRGVLGELSLGGVKNELGQTLRGGDRIVITEGNEHLGIDNGDTGTIVNITRPNGIMGKPTIHVKLDRTHEVGLFPTKDGPLVPLMERKDTVAIDMSKFDRVELGYATTVHKAQGTTVEKAFVLSNEVMQSRETSYTQLSRVRDQVKLYLTEAEAGEGLTEFARQAQRSQQKDLAHDRELTREQRVTEEHGVEVLAHQEQLVKQKEMATKKAHDQTLQELLEAETLARSVSSLRR